MTHSKSKALSLIFLFVTVMGMSLYSFLSMTPATAVAAPALQANICFVSLNGTSATHSSSDGSAVQAAINAASANATLKIAGNCINSSSTPVATINKNLTLVGGYAAGSWGATPDPVANPTVLDGGSNGRVALITNNAKVTLSYLTLRNGNAGAGFADFGGAINTESGTTLYLEQVHIKNSAAYVGGAIFNFGAVSMNNSQLSENTADAGGAIYNSAAVTITNSSLFSNTTTVGNGGAIYSDSPLTIRNSTFSYNSAGSGYGGAIEATNPFPVIIEYSTFSHNNASSVGGTLHGNSYVTLTSSIIANTSNGADCVNRSLSNVIVDGGANLVEDGSCINALTSQSGDPLLGPLTDNGGPTWTHALNTASIARNWIPYGYNGCGTTTLTDQRGLTRSLSVPCDIGAYELLGDTACYVETTGDMTTDFGSVDATALQTAVLNATPGATLKIAGTCAGVLPTGGLAQTVYINQSLTLRGGYTTTNWTTSNPATYPTVLDAQNNGRVIYIPNNNYRVTLDGLTIQNGSTTGDGGGIWTSDTLTVTNSIIRDNFAGNDGGGIYFGSGSIGYIDHTTIASNTLITTSGTYFGAGLYSRLSTITVANSAIYSNTGRSGGGISSYRDVMTISNSAIYGNEGTGQAGGIYNQEGTVYLLNSTVSQNHSPNGAGIFSYSSNTTLSTTLVLSHTTIANNSGNHGIRTVDNATGGGASVVTILYGSIIANNGNTECNTVGSAAQVDASRGYNLDSDGSCVTDGVDNNITADPLLLPLADNGGNTPTRALSPASPARNRVPFGWNGCSLNGDTDQRGVARANGSGCDSGAFEYENIAPVASDDTYTASWKNVPFSAVAPGVFSNDTNDDGDMFASLVSGPITGSLALNSDGSFTYTPTLHFNGIDSFTYTAADGSLPVVGHWAFNEGSGSYTYDASGNHITGTLVGDATFTTTRPSGLNFPNATALDLDGAGDRVDIPASNAINLTANNQRTVSAWFRADGVGVNSRKQIIWEEGGQTHGLNIYLFDNALYAGGWSATTGWNGTWLSTTLITSGQWHHVALVLDSDSTSGAVADSLFLYLDGALAQTGSAAQLASHIADNGIGDVNNDSKFHDSGAYSGSGNHAFAGQVDDVRVMNRAATAADVAVLMNTWPGQSDTAVVSIDFTTAVDLNCFVESTGDNLIDYASLDASAVQTAVSAANPGDTLKIAGTCAGVQTISDNSQTVYLDKSLTVQGGYTITNWLVSDPIANPTILDAENGGRVVYVIANQSVTLAGLTLTNGNGNGVNGGAVYIGSSGVVTITDSIIQNNTGRLGGGIYHSGASLLLDGVSLQSNTATQNLPNGGGVYNNGGSLTMRNSQLQENTGNWGGGLYNTGAAIIENSAFISNTGSYRGGGISNAGTVTITNSTFSGNTGNSVGGAVDNTSASSMVTLTHSTLFGNNADAGGGLYNDGGVFNLNGTIVAGSSSNKDCFSAGGTVSATYSLLASATNTCGLTDGVDGNIIGVDPFLGALADNGGPTLTHMPRIDSPAVNAGNCASGPAADQRGLTRPQDTTCDIGAVEVQSGEDDIQVCGLVEGGIYHFRATGVQIEIDTLGTLQCLDVAIINAAHPTATLGIPAPYVTITTTPAIASGFQVTMTLLHAGLGNPQICKYPGGNGGAGWDCARNGFNSNRVWRGGINGFSDWAVGNAVGPTAVTLQTITTTSATGWLVGWLVGLLGLATAVALRRRRVH